LEIIYFFATPLLIFSGIPQMARLIRRKQSDDISRLTYALTTTAIAILFIRSFHLGDLPLTIANGCSMTITGINTILIFKYKNYAENR